MSRSAPTVIRAAALGLGVAVIAAAQPGCAGCSARAPLGYVPADAVSVVVVPKIGALLEHLAALSGNFRKALISGVLIDRQAALLRAELGFDLEKPETLRTIGVNPAGGLALFFGAKGEVGLVLPVAEQQTLDGYLRRQLSKMLRGDALYRPGENRGVRLTTVSARNKKQVGAWAFVGTHVVLGGSQHGGADELVGRSCKLERAMSKDNPTFAAVQQQLGSADLFAYVDGAGLRKAMDFRSEQALAGADGWAKRFIAERKQTGAAALGYFRGLGVGLVPGAQGVELSAYYAAPAERLAALREIFSGKGDAVAFGKLIGPDALLIARASVNLKKLLDRAVELLPSEARRRIYERLQRIEREESFSVEKDLLAVLSGRFAAAVYAPSAERVMQAVRGAIPAAQLAPVAFVAQIEDAGRVDALLVRLERLLVMRGAAISVRREGDRRVFTLERGGAPVASWTATKKLFVLATGGRLAKTLELAEKGGENVLAHLDSAAAKAALKDDEGLLLTANMAKIAATLNAMDLGMEAKLMLAPVMGTLGRFKEITFTTGIVDAGLLARLAVVLQ